MQIGIAKPFIGEDEKRAVLDVLDTGNLVQGTAVAAFEAAFAEYQQVGHAVAVNNGTSALIAALMAHGIGQGDEVIIPSFSFFATASAVLSVKATPVFADIDPDTFCLSPEAAEAAITARTAAIMPVHLYGQPADMLRFEAICQRHGLLLLEDAAQAHGASVGQRKVGSWGTASFSFYPSKNMTTGEGGMITTNDEDIARKLRMIRNQGMNGQYHHEIVGYNFRMTNLAAAIGGVQLGRLPEWTCRRIENAAYYNQHITSVETPRTRAGCVHVFHQYTVRISEGQNRDECAARLNEKGIGARIYYPTPIHRQPIFAALPGYRDVSLPQTEAAVKSVLSLPVHPLLTSEERAYIVEEINRLC